MRLGPGSALLYPINNPHHHLLPPLPRHTGSSPVPWVAFQPGGRFGIDPTILHFGSHAFFTSKPDENEPNPYPKGKLAADIKLAGFDMVKYLADGKARVGLNGGLGTALHNDHNMVVFTLSAFIQINEHSRIEAGKAYAVSTNPELDNADKGALFVGVSFPTKVSDLFKFMR